MKVLIIEDVSMVRMQLNEIVRDLGFEVVEDSNIRKAENVLLTVAQYKPDIVLLDLNLHGNNSIGLIPEILAKCNASIVVCSGIRDEAIVMEAINRGAIDYLIKPINPFRIKHTLMKILSMRGDT